VRESARRRTLELAIERSGRLSLLVPVGTPEAALRHLVESRRAWLYEKLEAKAVQYRPARTREFVPGEGFWYAGRTYRLRLIEGSPGQAPLDLKAGWFELDRAQLQQGRDLFRSWYTAQLRTWLTDQLQLLTARLRKQPKAIHVQDLGYRWGSCGTKSELYFHWRLALLPRRIAEYVLIHELVHLEHPHHQGAFWKRVEALVPDCQERKAWLARFGADYDL
jgi:predicted metal-dependent hydrolase